MKISIIIPNYNGLNFLNNCIYSLQNQSYKDFEIIVVDNNSEDGSCEYLSKNYSKIILIKLDKNYGFSKAVNEGIKSSTSKYIVLLNNDTEVDSYWLENLVSFVEKNEKIFSVCSKMIRYHEKDRLDDAGDEYTILGWAYKRGDGFYINQYDKAQQVFSSCAGAAIYRKSILEEIGYFDEDFFAYMEDVDISYRAKIYGYKNIYCPEAVVYHIGSATSGSKYNSFKVRLAARNNVYVPYKNMPLLQLILNFPFLLLGFFIKYIFFKKAGFNKEYVAGIKEAVKAITKIKKVKYRNKNLINYFKIQIELVVNAFKYIHMKVFKKNVWDVNNYGSINHNSQL